MKNLCNDCSNKVCKVKGKRITVVKCPDFAEFHAGRHTETKNLKKPMKYNNREKIMPYKRFMKVIFFLILLNAVNLAQIRHLSEAELRNELMRCLIERLGFKQQAELTDSLVSEIQKSHQREWLKDYENKVCSDDKFNLAQKLLNPDCPSPPFYDNFAFGFLSTIFLIILIYGGILIL